MRVVRLLRRAGKGRIGRFATAAPGTGPNTPRLVVSKRIPSLKTAVHPTDPRAKGENTVLVLTGKLMRRDQRQRHTYDVPRRAQKRSERVTQSTRSMSAPGSAPYTCHRIKPTLLQKDMFFLLDELWHLCLYFTYFSLCECDPVRGIQSAAWPKSRWMD